MTSIPLYRCTAVYSLMHLLMDTWVCPVWGYHEQSHYDYSSPSLCYGEKNIIKKREQIVPTPPVSPPRAPET